MTDSDDLRRSLSPILERISRWRADANIVSALAQQALQTQQVDSEQMQRVEEITSDIYAEISQFDLVVNENERADPTTIQLIAGVSDALRLVLLEITEFGTAIYGAGSPGALAGCPKA